MFTAIFKGLFSHASVGNPGGFHVEGPLIVVIPVAIAFVYFFARSIAWVHHDAVQRNKDGVVAALFILLTGWPASFIRWFWLRPPLSLPSTGQDQTTA